MVGVILNDSGSDLAFDENKTLYSDNPSTDTYTTLANALPYISYNANMDLDPVHHYLVLENGANTGKGQYHLRILNIDSCNGKVIPGSIWTTRRLAQVLWVWGWVQLPDSKRE